MLAGAFWHFFGNYLAVGRSLGFGSAKGEDRISGLFKCAAVCGSMGEDCLLLLPLAAILRIGWVLAVTIQAPRLSCFPPGDLPCHILGTQRYDGNLFWCARIDGIQSISSDSVRMGGPGG